MNQDQFNDALNVDDELVDNMAHQVNLDHYQALNVEVEEGEIEGFLPQEEQEDDELGIILDYLEALQEEHGQGQQGHLAHGNNDPQHLVQVGQEIDPQQNPGLAAQQHVQLIQGYPHLVPQQDPGADLQQNVQLIQQNVPQLALQQNPGVAPQQNVQLIQQNVPQLVLQQNPGVAPQQNGQLIQGDPHLAPQQNPGVAAQQHVQLIQQNVLQLAPQNPGLALQQNHQPDHQQVGDDLMVNGHNGQNGMVQNDIEDEPNEPNEINDAQHQANIQEFFALLDQHPQIMQLLHAANPIVLQENENEMNGENGLNGNPNGNDENQQNGHPENQE